MITAIMPDAATSGTTNLPEHRFRAAMGERTMLPDGASMAGQFPQGERQTPPQPALPRKDSSSMFAAAVIAGALSPTPKTMDELVRRIGSSPIPEESEARLKDMLA